MGEAPSHYAKRFIDKLPEMAQTAWGREEVQRGSELKGYGIYSTSSGPYGTSTLYNLVLGNDKTGTLYLMVFESPERSWEEAWKKGRTIVDNVILDMAF